MLLEFDNPTKVIIIHNRWTVQITIDDEVYIVDASIDSGNSIWFGTLQEFEEDQA